ncbi:transglycosylase SLT domain-containing protein [Saccharopolyspora spinosa]|uniref:transglycosylase SLT domain-containing protein n=1 Tax=Saccharopolyspora spinosa TaxID=60894 RepID=UPI0002379DFB|nr:type VII secretion target [Saccharopolyspora spinosa]
MSELTAEQIAQHAYDAGFRGKALTTSVAVALAESSGNPRSHNPTPPDDSYGLWQVNMLGDMGPERRKQFGLDSNKDLFNPDENAKAAYAISNQGKSFDPWSTYTNGAYKKHLDEAEAAAKAVTGNGGKTKAPEGSPGDGGGGKPGGDGFKVAPDQLLAYTKEADDIAGQLANTGAKTVHSVTGIANDSFGAVGQETGFSAALGDFSKSLEKQVNATGANARKLGAATTDAAKAYRDTDEESARELKKLLT